ncbi:hypothetical protein BT96DRAFT_950849 [Gymnopus androsaceus JB14]|uniref:DNA breaking-rejoining enzyme n=1 Tax=Gymnopus androsaceus JB14 TaxID=1447944 RepID=A0A6A4GFB6_9AGAR|nr:hypothetical protein BT96DRAFT_950849 [Gymnopus androsaceus JB14]
MITLWGSDEIHTCLSPAKWKQATKNLLTALLLLSESLSPTKQLTRHTFAEEFWKHRKFFTQYGDYEENYQHWYSFERTAHHDILKFSPSSPLKRTSDSDLCSHTKVAQTLNNSPGSSQPDAKPGPRNSSPPSCLTCCGPHILRDHPAGTTTFADGKPCFSVTREGLLWTVKPYRGRDTRQICINFNLPAGCRRDVTRSTHISRSKVNGHRVTSFHIPWTKTTGILGSECLLTETFDNLCPVWAFENHLLINHSPIAVEPLFSYCNDTSWTTLLKSHFLDFTGSIFKQANLENVFGHSYRIGGSLKLLLDGVAPEIIMKLGGWTSLCFLIYWQQLEKVLPAAITHAWASHIKDFALRNGINPNVDELDIE